MIVSITILISLSISFLIWVIINVSVNYNDYKFYKRTYKAIMNREYVLVRDGHEIETYRRPVDSNNFSNDEILFFFREGKIDSIKLLSNGLNYIHKSSRQVDPYCLYWFKKIMKAREHNHFLFQRNVYEQLCGTTIGNSFVLNENRKFKFLRNND